MCVLLYTTYIRIDLNYVYFSYRLVTQVRTSDEQFVTLFNWNFKFCVFCTVQLRKDFYGDIMSTKSTSPPQTYSRLFRPWDGTAKKVEGDCSEFSENELKTNLKKFKLNKPSAKDGLSERLSGKCVEKFVPHSSNSSPTTAMNQLSSAVISDMAFNTAKNIYDSFMPTLPMEYAPELSFYNASPAKCGEMIPIPFNVGVGMDPYGIGIMEQEYARIMAEEARTKAMNARKQRPKKFKCPHCDVAFSNNGQLKGHIRIHTGKLRYF